MPRARHPVLKTARNLMASSAFVTAPVAVVIVMGRGGLLMALTGLRPDATM
jgi:hypothetical protein